MEKERIVKCADCGRVLDEQTDRPVEHRDPCRACGSRMRHVELTIEDPLEFHDQVHVKAEDSQGKTFLKGKKGDDDEGEFHGLQSDDTKHIVYRGNAVAYRCPHCGHEHPLVAFERPEGAPGGYRLL